MPKYLVTSGSHFEPFTYDELIQPVVAAQQAHDQVQEAYDALEMETSALDRYISSERGSGDEEARKLYDNYMSKLSALQEDLYNNGFSTKTKRSLASARNMFARDITRLSKAVEARQNRSSEYWKAKHDHPDMIMADDPGLSGLDNYLNDDLYGQNYYQYNGAQFESDIASAAKARAAEVFNEPMYRNNPYMAGYKQRIDREGFTDAEISSAVDAVRNGGEDNLDVPSRILYDVLSSGLKATGAYGNVSDAEYDRLIDYGRRGLSHAIGSPRYTDIQDRAWERPTASVPSGAGSEAEDVPFGYGYQMNNTISPYQSFGFAESSKEYKKQNKKFESGPVRFYTSDGRDIGVKSYEEMTDYIYNHESRQEGRNDYGLDIALSPKKLEKIMKGKYVYADDGGGEKQSYTVKVMDDGNLGFYYNNHGTQQLNKAITDDFKNLRNSYLEHLESVNEKNPHLKDKFDKYALSPEEEFELREKYNISPYATTSDVFAVQRTKERVGAYSNAPLFNGTVGLDAVRTTISNAIQQSHNEALGNSKGNTLSKDSKYNIYKVDGGDIVSGGRGDAIPFDNVFKDGQVDGNLMSVSFTPEDIAKGAKEGIPMFRFTSKSAPGVYASSAQMLGDITYNSIKDELNIGPFDNESVCDVVDYMLKPIIHPNEAVSMSDDEIETWISKTTQILNGTALDRYKTTGDLLGPMKYGVEVTPRDIVHNEGFQNDLYNDITTFINEMISNPRDVMQRFHPQYQGNSSTKPQGYLPQE